MTIPVVRFTVRGVDAVMSPGRDYTVVYDGTCKTCTRLVGVLEKWDKTHHLEIVPSQAAGIMARFPWIPAHAYSEALQLVAANGTTWQGSAAIEQLLNVLPKGKLFAWLFHVPFVRTIADRFYKWFARNRYKLGCGEHCQSRPLDVDFRDT
ncbi:MAG TPA: DUF393 domain-containing protein [Gemmatimonadaceae bacterium]|jgi:predicted DCC family thiol-disulfide oxidoreductase YuxK